GPEVFAFADKSALTPLDDFAQGTVVNAERFLPGYWDMGVHEGRLYGVPAVPAVTGLYWNKRLFREAGLDPERPPRTLPELDEFARRLTRVQDGKITQAGFLPSQPAGWFPFMWPYFFGGKLWDGGSHLTLNDAANIRAFEWVQGYAKFHGVAALQNMSAGFGSSASAQDPFLSGKLGMVFQGVWLPSYIDRFAPNLEWGAAPFPGLDAAGAPIAYIDADMLVIPRGSRHAREAFEFMRYVARTEVMEKLCRLQHKNSPLREVTPSFFTGHPHREIRMFQALAASPAAVSAPKLPIWAEYRAEIVALFQRVWLVQASPQQALDEAQGRLQRSLDRARARRAIPPRPALSWAPWGLLAFVFTGALAFAWWRRGHWWSVTKRRSPRSNASLPRGLAFFSPWAVGFLVFTAYPIAASLIYSLCDYSALSPPKFVGLDNYAELLSDRLFLIALKNTLTYVGLALPLGLGSSFAVALLLDAKVRGSSVYRTLVFLPSLTPVVVSSMVWLWIFNAQYGVLNQLLGKLSFGLLGPVAWLSDPHTALPSLVLMSLWGGGHTVVVLLAAMQDVPAAMYEAADIDGASFWHKVRHITLPLTSPVLYFNGIMGIISGLQIFAQPYIMTGGGPARATMTYAMRLYENAFAFLRMGYAAAMAWILFLLVLLLTWLAVRVASRRVHYT
ncbi:MAG TPA: extracellular solute-binding protein, partial [Polyangiaceae bacterium]|nr:extracellular solute-binding protein [Polyangiaceae bacterium]